MQFNTPDDDLLKILAFKPKIKPELKESAETSINIPDLTDDGTDLNNYTIKLLIESIRDQQNIIKFMRDELKSIPDPIMAASLAGLEKSCGDNTKLLAELSMHKGRIVSQEKIKKNDLELKKEIAFSKEGKLDLGSNNNITFVTATRDEIFKSILKQGVDLAVDGLTLEAIVVPEHNTKKRT